jgi:hypothetical protein
MYFLPYGILALLAIVVLTGGVYGWEYSNSPQFCGTTCHTMPPQNTAYLQSPHANVTCEECHIGRASLPDQMMRKTQGLKEAYYTIFNLYEFPIRASALQPARDTCEKCHKPETLSSDSLRSIMRFASDKDNSPQTTYLILKTGGGAKREGLGRGIHWHIVNKVSYIATDDLEQSIPFIRVYNDDGTTTDYVDIESGFNAASVEEGQLQEIDCTTCHNRVTHEFKYPEDSMDEAMSRKLIDPSIPDIHTKGIEVLTAKYTSQEEAFTAITGLENYYKTYYADFYNSNQDTVNSALEQIKKIYADTVFHDQKIDWTTYPNNLGHINSPGCFRCHDGKHLNADDEAIRMECNLCHSIPAVASAQDFVTKIEISRGPEPETHRNPNWISLHNQVFDSTCSNCHTTEGAGGTTNTSFCSNSACHGTVFTYAGFDAPKLREALQAQLPTPVPTQAPAPVTGNPTFEANIGPLFVAANCTMCHGASASAGLSFLTYADTIKGAADGPVIIPGDSANSKLIQVQSGSHFAKLDANQLELVKQWIDAGAPEK